MKGYYLVGINGKELTGEDDLCRFPDDTSGKQTVLLINSAPAFKEAWKEIATPVQSESVLRL